MTVPVPSSKGILTGIGVVVAGLVLVLVGARFGAELLRPSAVMSVADGGGLHQVQLLGGLTYIGTIVSDDDGAVRLQGPAIVREEPLASAAADGSTTRIVVQSLASDPFAIEGDVVIPLDQVALVGVIAPGSGMAGAYAQAMGAAGEPEATPAP